MRMSLTLQQELHEFSGQSRNQIAMFVKQLCSVLSVPSVSNNSSAEKRKQPAGREEASCRLIES